MSRRHIDSETLTLIRLLKIELEKVYGSFGPASSFERIAELFVENSLSSKHNVDESTVRNLFKDDIPKTKPTNKTLEKLVRLLDGKYKNWDHFCHINRLTYFKESYYNPFKYKVSEMIEGEEITIGWFPFRYALLKYKGDFLFEVIDSTRDINLKRGEIKEMHGFGISYLYHMNTMEDDDKNEFAEGYIMSPNLTYRSSVDTDIAIGQIDSFRVIG